MENELFKKIDTETKALLLELKEYGVANVVTKIDELSTKEELTEEEKETLDLLETTFHYVNEALKVGGTIRTALLHVDVFMSKIK